MGKIDKILQTFKITKDSLVNELTTLPKKTISKGSYNNPYILPHQYHQMDILYLPHDNGFKYALVIVDIATKQIQARPQKTKLAKETLKSIKSIYGTGRKTLPKPTILHADGGTEFKGVVKEWVKDNNIALRISTPFRHQQQSVVEAMNKIIGSAIIKIQTNDELMNNDGQLITEWTTFLPTIVEVLNNSVSKYTPKQYKGTEPIKCKKSECYAYKEGTKVRVALKRDDFRSGDIRWSKNAHTITKVLLLPNRPIMYMVDGYRNAFYKNELKPYREIQGNKVIEKYEVEALRKRFKKNGKIYYKVKWKGYRKLTDEPRSSLIRDVPDLVLDYESETV